MFQKFFQKDNKKQGFLPVSSDENAASESEAFDLVPSNVSSLTTSFTLLIVAVALFFSSVGFFAGRHIHQERFNAGLLGRIIF